VTAKLTVQEQEQIASRIRDAFEQFNSNRAAPDASFGNMAVSMLDPVQAGLTDVERRRMIDRLSGAMAAFCQGLGQQRAA
jgi:hypothetical protein